MDFQLNSGIDRKHTNCIKWDVCADGVIPMWVADMDFPCSPKIVEALMQRASHAAYGYTTRSEADDQATIDFYTRNHGYTVKKEDMLFTPGVVDSLLLAVHALTEPGDKVLIQTPVYGPFYSVVNRAGRTLVENPLLETDSGKWEMDFEDLDAKLPGCQLMLLCSPHNPFGRVWPREDLQKVLDLCKKHNVYLMCDEIHCDLALGDHQHVSALTLSGADKGVAIAVSATKTFNIAGMKHSTLFAPDETMRKKLSDKANQIGMSGNNLMGLVATTAAYTHGDAWLAEVKKIILKNRDLAVEKLTAVGCKVFPIEGTYLLFADMRPFGKTCDELYDLILAGGVRLNKGTDFGPRGDGFMRINLATPESLCAEGIDRICKVLESL